MGWYTSLLLTLLNCIKKEGAYLKKHIILKIIQILLATKNVFKIEVSPLIASYSLISTSDVIPTNLWLKSDAYSKQNWKHFRRFKVVIWLVVFYNVSGRSVYLGFFNGPRGNKAVKTR